MTAEKGGDSRKRETQEQSEKKREEKRVTAARGETYGQPEKKDREEEYQKWREPKKARQHIECRLSNISGRRS